ncbi:hypothetical protein [Halopseudomonas sabulinigri]|uniref:Uncharacterized protein n=1 Tax=Halopseudomonas sabulinigri TaxID=472181 RepID=A0ABP9ZU13_9GAMM
MIKYQVSPKEFFTRLESAIESSSFDDVEEMRDYVSLDFAEDLTGIYRELDDWWKKELIIHLVQDQLSEEFSEILLDAINAPSAESKAYSICFREKDRTLFNKYLVNHMVSEDLVKKDLSKYVGAKEWWQLWK